MAASRNNVRKRGSTWTYYVYVTDGDGRRRQVPRADSGPGQEAEAARIEALGSLQNGTWVRPERVTVREFLEDEWLPTQAPPTLEESTYRSYTRNVRLHVVPHIGGIALQQLTPLDLTAMYRTLLESGRRPPRHPDTRSIHPEVGELVDELRCRRASRGKRLPTRSAEAFPDEAGITRHAVAALHRRRHAPPTPRNDASRPAAADGALRPLDRPRRAQGRHALEPGRSRTSPTPPLPRRMGSTLRGRRTTWTAAQLRRFLDFIADGPLPRAVDLPRHDRVPARRVPRPAVGRPRPRRARRRSSPAR